MRTLVVSGNDLTEDSDKTEDFSRRSTRKSRNDIWNAGRKSAQNIWNGGPESRKSAKNIWDERAEATGSGRKSWEPDSPMQQAKKARLSRQDIWSRKQSSSNARMSTMNIWVIIPSNYSFFNKQRPRSDSDRLSKSLYLG